MTAVLAKPVPVNTNTNTTTTTTAARSRDFLERQAFEAFKAFVIAFQDLVSCGVAPAPALVEPSERDPTSDVITADEAAAFLGVGLRLRGPRRDPAPAARQTAHLPSRRARRLARLFLVQGHVDSERLTMPVRRSKDGRWRYRHVVHYPDGTRERISGSAPNHINTKVAAEQAMLDHIERCLHPERKLPRKGAPTFREWFKGRFWDEWVIGRKNKPGEQYEKTVIFGCHLEPRFGDMALDEITVSEIARFRAHLVAAELSEKRINNILAVLSKALRYAADCELIERAPKISMFKVERPEIVAWDFEQYARLLATAKAEGEEWYVAVCLAGEAGLRVGEIKALRWREDVDLIARTLTVNQQTCRGQTGTPKGRTRRTVPMTATLYEALKRMSAIREGFVVRNLDGTAKTDKQAVHALARICRLAGLPVRQWHTLRHAYGTHAALFGVNPWRLQTWLGHKRIDETMLYVHVAEAHAREWPEAVTAAANGEIDPDKRILAMLGARGSIRGKGVAKTPAAADRSAVISAA